VSMQMPIVRLYTGLRVGNFSSDLEYQFECGQVLPPCSRKRQRRLRITTVTTRTRGVCDTIDVTVEHALSDRIIQAYLDACDDPSVDIVLVSAEFMAVLKEGWDVNKFRVAMRADDGILYKHNEFLM